MIRVLHSTLQKVGVMFRSSVHSICSFDIKGIFNLQSERYQLKC